MKILACPKCGSNRIVLKGKSASKVCEDCYFSGNFIEFDSREDYDTFFKERKKENEMEQSNWWIDQKTLAAERLQQSEEDKKMRSPIKEFYLALISSIFIVILFGKYVLSTSDLFAWAFKLGVIYFCSTLGLLILFAGLVDFSKKIKKIIKKRRGDY
jgi:hypothetical protein